MPGTELFLEIRFFLLEETTCPAASLLGAELFPEIRFFLKKPLVQGSCVAWGKTVFSENCLFLEEATCLRCLGQSFFQKSGLVEAYNVNNLNRMHFQNFWNSCAQNKASENIESCTFRKSGTPVRRTERRKSQKMHCQEFWDSCTQNNTSEITKMQF